MVRAGYMINGFPTSRQSGYNIVDMMVSLRWRGEKVGQAAGVLSTRKNDRYLGGFVANNMNKIVSRNGGLRLRNARKPRLRISQCSTKPDIAGDAVSGRESQSDGSADLAMGEKDLQSETCDGSHVLPVGSLPSETDGLVFGLGQSDSFDSMEVGCPIVRRYLSDNEERWYMWYSGKRQGSRDSVGLAVSSNGIHWQRGTGPIETDEDVGIVMECSDDWWAFDTKTVRPSDILIMSGAKVRASSGVYWLYYAGCNSEEVKVPQILHGNSERYGDDGHESSFFRLLPGLAMSQDGRNWARIEGDHYSGALFDVGAEGEWDSLFIAAPQVVSHSPTDLRLYYHSLDVKSGHFAVGIARSRDGIQWVKLGMIFERGQPGSFDEFGVTSRYVIRNQEGNGYLMIYEGLAANGVRSIGLAESSDGLKKWEKCQNDPVFEPALTSTAWDSRGVGSPCLVQMDGDGEWRLYYQGVDRGGKTGIGMAVCTDGNLRSFKRWHGFHV